MSESSSASSPALGGHGAHPVDPVRLRDALSPTVRGWTIEIVDRTGSTHADVMTRLAKLPSSPAASAQAGAAAWAPIVRSAAEQTAGRGRHGRPWLAAPGDALLFSLGYPLARRLSALSGLSLAVGCAVLRGLRRLPVNDASRLALKWPNDVLLDGRKLAGILIETAGHSSESCVVAIGIGINLRNSHALAQRIEAESTAATGGLRPAALADAFDADIAAQPTLATDAFAQVLNALAETLAQFATDGFAPFRAAWCADHAYEGQMVSLLDGGREILRGVACGVDADGRLLIDSGGGPRPVTSGEISLRPATAAGV